MSDNNNAKTMYEAVPAAAELNRVPGFDPLKFLRRAGDSMKLDLPYQKLWFRMAHPNGRMRLTAMRITEQMAIFEAKVFLDRSDAEPFSVSVAQQTMQDRLLVGRDVGLIFLLCPCFGQRDDFEQVTADRRILAEGDVRMVERLHIVKADTPCAVAADQIRRPLFTPLKAGVGKR